MIRELDTGIQTYSDHEGTVAAHFNTLSTAQNVLLTCHSNGCNGLQMTFDQRASMIESMTVDAEVRAVFNNYFIASLEGEYAIDETSQEGVVDMSRSIYDHVVVGNGIGRDENGNNQRISAQAYETGSERQRLERFGAEMDSSCLAYHGDDDALCYNSLHVLFNHLNRPFFYNFAQADKVLISGDTSPYCENDAGESVSCGTGWPDYKIKWQTIVRKQAADMINLGETHRCEAASEGPAPYDGIFVWAPQWDVHAGWHEDKSSENKLSLSGNISTLRKAVYLWATTTNLKGVCLERDPNVHSSADNIALEVPNCLGEN